MDAIPLASLGHDRARLILFLTLAPLHDGIENAGAVDGNQGYRQQSSVRSGTAEAQAVMIGKPYQWPGNSPRFVLLDSPMRSEKLS